MAKAKDEKEEKAEKVYSEGIISAKKIKTDLRKKEPPLIDVKVTNPVTYIKSWWKKVIGNEGIDFRLKIRPLTAIAITIIVITVSLGIGKFELPFKIPFFVYNSKITPTPSPETVIRESAFTGILQYTSASDRYYLITNTSEAITLQVPNNIDLGGYVGNRILAVGEYNENLRILVVINATDLEILPVEVSPVPTIATELTSSPSITPTREPIMSLTPEPTIEDLP